jgi:hypothetical protein
LYSGFPRAIPIRKRGELVEQRAANAGDVVPEEA